MCCAVVLTTYVTDSVDMPFKGDQLLSVFAYSLPAFGAQSRLDGDCTTAFDGSTLRGPNEIHVSNTVSSAIGGLLYTMLLIPNHRALVVAF